MPDAPDSGFVHDSAGGGLLMRCPICHRSRYVSEYLVFVRKELQHCPDCADASAILEPVRHADEESASHRLRSQHTGSAGRGKAD